MEDIKVRFGKKVRELRLLKEISQEKLAELADLDRTYIPGIESGKRNVSITVMEKLSIALEVNLSDLLKNL
ncbi:helix-turn-helix transcriptional regulator [Algibacter amylolyticus]|uniref:Helix-turn-helix transcriptional regulator n=1 Tax=Algibacter amylolyticus TaxID=1608400 RepID=A0A5M7BJJ4_9FLAO|nr:helix-turn-helix transcriptional regulator [Algibacter amylolyticus]KAA5827744.1 helix-turn-helix transcriptional regulator [Algibacter amylolyticus]MBB5266967.1 transcriptional regulator with XRE-family HTH domain [Algibacter amylolyticus]TSJ81989.1 helix-turn-helix transcriptional regulator [Algibacter amylolyticus]